MILSKWIAATAVLAMGLSAGAFAENEHGRRDRDGHEQPVFSQRYSNYRDYASNSSYRGRDQERNGAWDNNYNRERNSGDRDMRNRDHRDREYGRRDSGDRD